MLELLYTALLYLIQPLIWIRLWVRGRKAPAYRKRWGERYGFYRHPLKPGGIMLPSVSVGETLAAIPLVRALRHRYPDLPITVTTMTPTGSERVQSAFGKDVQHVYLPYDLPDALNRFLNKVDPKLVLIMETELWPNIGYCSQKYNIPLIILNGRMSDRTYGSYKKLSLFFKPVLKKYTKILTQSESDNNKLISIGANPDTTKIMGNLKFDIDVNLENFSPINKNPGDRIIIAGSTHTGEDEIILTVFNKIRNENIKLLVAPRHPERNDSVYDLFRQTGLKVGRRSSGDDFTNHDIIILDTLGELGKMYSICDFAFIGGSFNKIGGHNPLESVIFNKPVISGPNIQNFKDIYAIITRTDAGVIVKDEAELIEQMQKLIENQEYYKKACDDCKFVFDQNRGATQYVINELKTLINM